MANITYYLGAGASYFACPILEKQAEMMIKLAMYELHKYAYKDIRKLKLNFIESEKPKDFIDDNKFEILWHIGYFGKKAQEYNTIDTYARKLYLNNELKELNLLKMSVSVFFDLWENFYQERYSSLTEPEEDLINFNQNHNKTFYYDKIDKRYKSLFSVLLEKNSNSIELNSNFKFISWNYDLQLEEAFKIFLSDKYDKSYESINRILKFKFNNTQNDIFHLNGYRGFYSYKTKSDIEIKESDDFEMYWHIIDSLYSETTTKNISFNNHIKYAWEHNIFDEFLKNAGNVMKKTEVLVIVGYSFPAFNRQIDQFLFANLNPDTVRKIIYQDPNGTKEIIENLFETPRNFTRKIEVLNNQKDLNQFIIPTEFFNPNFNKKDNFSAPTIL